MRPSTLLWSLLAAALLAFGGSRILAGLGDQETQVRRQLLALMEAVERDEGRGLRRFVSRDYIDEDTGLEYDELRYALRGDGVRYLPRLPEEGGIEFLPSPPDSKGADPEGADSEGADSEDGEACTVRLRCSILRSRSGGPPEPYWDLEATLELVRRRGSWVVRRSRDVNHARRGRG